MSFCSNCGKKINADAKFCSSCGHKASTPLTDNRNTRGETFIVKPVFNATVVLGRNAPLIIFVAIWSSIFFGGFSGIFFSSHGSFSRTNFLVFGIISLVLATSFMYIQTKKNYEKTTYEFLPDRLVYYDGFWNRTKKELNYRSITEIGYNEGIFQRNFNLGDLILSTPATTKKSGLRLKDIENVEEVYNRFKINYDQSNA